MKKIILLAFGLCVCGGAMAQTVGAKAGLNVSNMIRTGDDNFDTDFKTGLHAGLTLEIPLGSGVSFAPELMYSQKGYKTSGSSLIGGEYEYSVTTNFIELPVLLRIGTGSNINFSIGPQISFLTSTTESFQRGSEQYRNTVRENNENLRKSLVGGVVGIGFDINPRTSLHGRYAIDLQSNNENGTTTTPEYKNQVISVGLGFRF